MVSPELVTLTKLPTIELLLPPPTVEAGDDDAEDEASALPLALALALLLLAGDEVVLLLEPEVEEGVELLVEELLLANDPVQPLLGSTEL